MSNLARLYVKSGQSERHFRESERHFRDYPSFRKYDQRQNVTRRVRYWLSLIAGGLGSAITRKVTISP